MPSAIAFTILRCPSADARNAPSSLCVANPVSTSTAAVAQPRGRGMALLYTPVAAGVHRRHPSCTSSASRADSRRYSFNCRSLRMKARGPSPAGPWSRSASHHSPSALRASDPPLGVDKK